MGTTATIDGQTILGDFGWALRAGTDPAQAVANVTREAMKKLLGGAPRPKTLRIKSDVGGAGNFGGIYVLHGAPADVPAHGRVVLQDRRWCWPYATFRRYCNITRKVGT